MTWSRAAPDRPGRGAGNRKSSRAGPLAQETGIVLPDSWAGPLGVMWRQTNMVGQALLALGWLVSRAAGWQYRNTLRMEEYQLETEAQEMALRLSRRAISPKNQFALWCARIWLLTSWGYVTI